jgi:uncharacterized membrane protein
MGSSGINGSDVGVGRGSIGYMKAKYYSIITIGAAIGLVASFMQIIEKLMLLENKNATLVCNISSVFNCSSVLHAWQSSVFGFPNSLICIIFFSLVMTVGLVGVTGGEVMRNMRLTVHALMVGMLGFALWFLFQSMFVIGAVCILCLFCFLGLLMINGAMLRLNFGASQEVKDEDTVMSRIIHYDIDLIAWVILAMIIITCIAMRFYV